MIDLQTILTTVITALVGWFAVDYVTGLTGLDPEDAGRKTRQVLL